MPLGLSSPRPPCPVQKCRIVSKCPGGRGFRVSGLRGSIMHGNKSLHGARRCLDSRFGVVKKAIVVCTTEFCHSWNLGASTWHQLGRYQGSLEMPTQPHPPAPPLPGYGPECLQTPARGLYPTACRLLRASRIKSVSRASRAREHFPPFISLVDRNRFGPIDTKKKNFTAASEIQSDSIRFNFGGKE